MSYFRVNLETFCARKVGEHDCDFYQDCSKDGIASKWQKLRIICAFGAKCENKISHDLNTVE